ncbi:MAG: outer membrane beta-barrel protein [Magnetococcales bacterium]|nr:outer membrane beta-barrel protein [Magnetococcales bacterium]
MSGGRRRTGYAIFLTLGISTSVGGAIFAADAPKGIAMGIFRVSPKMVVTSQYNENIDAAETNTTSDQVLTTSTSVAFTTRWRRNAFTGTLGADQGRHKNTGPTNDYNDYSAKLAFKFQPRRRLKFDMNYDYVVKHDDQADASSGAYNQHSLTTSAAYRFKKFTATVNTTTKQRRSSDPAQRETDPLTNGLGLTVAYPVTPKTSFDTNATYSQQRYDRLSSRNNQSYTGNIGVSWKAAAKTRGNFMIGVTSRHHEDNSGLDNKAALVLGSGIDWKASSKAYFSLNLKRSFEDGGTTDAYSVDTSATLSAQYTLRSYLSMSGSMGYKHSAFTKTQKDETWNAALGAQYKFPRWLSLGVDLTRTMKDSNASGSSYANNTYSVSLTGGL